MMIVTPFSGIIDELVEAAGNASDPAGVAEAPETKLDIAFIKVAVIDQIPRVSSPPRILLLSALLEELKDDFILL